VSGTNRAIPLSTLKGKRGGARGVAVKDPISSPSGKRGVKTSSSEDLRGGGGYRRPSDVAEVLEAFKVAFALADSALLTLAVQPAANAMARRAIDRYGLPRVLAAVSIAPRHKWISAEFLAKRALPSLSIILSEKVLSQLVAEVSER
jgi:hypothetical protein